jgi:hypothetical protein
VIERTEKEWRALDQILAVYLFGYRWFRFTHDRKASDPGPEQTFYSLQSPATWITRHGGQLVDKPEPGVELDIDIPYYHKAEELVPKVMAALLKVDCEHHVIVYETKSGYCCGCLGEGMAGDLGFFPTISKALAVYAVHALKLSQMPVYQP